MAEHGTDAAATYRALPGVKQWWLRRGHPLSVGMETRPGWSGSLEFFLFMCPTHGPVKNYKHGFRGVLECPHCLDESTARSRASVRAA